MIGMLPSIIRIVKTTTTTTTTKHVNIYCAKNVKIYFMRTKTSYSSTRTIENLCLFIVQGW